MTENHEAVRRSQFGTIQNWRRGRQWMDCGWGTKMVAKHWHGRSVKAGWLKQELGRRRTSHCSSGCERQDKKYLGVERTGEFDFKWCIEAELRYEGWAGARKEGEEVVKLCLNDHNMALTDTEKQKEERPKIMATAWVQAARTRADRQTGL